MHRTSRLLRVIAATCLLVFLPALVAQADSISFGSPGSSQYVAGAISASDGTVTITLNNLLTNNQVISIGQNISGVYFTVGGYTGSGSLLSSSAQYLTVLSNGQATTQTGPIPTNWMVVNNVGGGLAVCVICPGTNAPAGPGYTIIGGTGAGSYTNANGSLNGNKPHNPYLAGTVTFTITLPGVTSTSQFSNVLVQFGTNPTPPTAVPESDSLLALILSSLSIVGGLLIRRRVQTVVD